MTTTARKNMLNKHEIAFLPSDETDIQELAGTTAVSSTATALTPGRRYIVINSSSTDVRLKGSASTVSAITLGTLLPKGMAIEFDCESSTVHVGAKSLDGTSQYNCTVMPVSPPKT